MDADKIKSIKSMWAPREQCPAYECEQEYAERQARQQSWHQWKLAEARCQHWRQRLMQEYAAHTNFDEINSVGEKLIISIPDHSFEPLMKMATKIIEQSQSNLQWVSTSGTRTLDLFRDWSNLPISQWWSRHSAWVQIQLDCRTTHSSRNKSWQCNH